MTPQAKPSKRVLGNGAPQQIHCDTRALVNDTCQHRTGQTMGPQGHNECPLNDRADAGAKQATAPHPLQPRPRVRRRPGEPLVSSEARSVRSRRRSASVVAGAQPQLLEPVMPRAQSMPPGEGRERDTRPSSGGFCLHAIMCKWCSAHQAHVQTLPCGPYACYITGGQAAASLRSWRCVDGPFCPWTTPGPAFEWISR